jgi:hypothetical protein
MELGYLDPARDITTELQDHLQGSMRLLDYQDALATDSFFKQNGEGSRDGLSLKH